MNYSTNYSMREPVPGEKVKVADINYNTEIIDGVMLDNRQISIDMYDDTSTYNTDDLAGHENSSGRIAVYRCLQDNTTGAWDSTKWVQTNLADEITDIRGNAGASDLGDLGDVEITTPTDGQALLYDPNTAKWHNSDLPDADVTKNASGNPIEFSDGADAPLVKCVTEIQGSQDLHGYDKPWVGGSGKNKIPVLLSEVKSNNTDGTWSGDTYSYSGVTFKVDSNSEGYVTKITVNASPSSSAFSFYLQRMTTVYAVDMILNGCPSGGGDATYDLRVSGGYRDIGSGVTIPANISFNVFWIVIRSGITVSNLVFEPMIRLATVTDSTFEPYSNICPITAYTEGEIEMRGKNLIDESTVVSGEYLNDSGVPTFVAHGAYYAQHIPVRSGTYKISFTKASDNLNFYLRIHGYNSSKIWQSLVYKSSSTIVEGGFYSYSFTVPTGISFVRFSFGDDISNVQIEEGTTTTAYEPYKGTTHTTTYPSAIYRGSEDVVKGSVTGDWIVKELNGTEGFALFPASGANPRRFLKSVSALGWPAVNTSGGESISDKFVAAGSTPTDPFGTFRLSTYLVFPDSDERFADATEFNQWLADNHTQIAYPLATPTTSSVTPTNLPIKSLSGYSHIESTTGEMEVEYIAKAFSPITEIVDSQISALQKMMELMLTSARETTMTASANYASGTLIVACGALYKATTAISSGTSLVVGTNITSTTIAAEIAALA